MWRYIGEGEYIPFGWAIAYRDFDHDTKVAYPIPLHFLVRWLRDVWCWLMTVGRPGYRERLEHEAFVRGIVAEAQRCQGIADEAYERGIADERKRTLTVFDTVVEEQRAKDSQ